MENLFTAVSQPVVIKVSRTYPISVTAGKEEQLGEVLSVCATPFISDVLCKEGLVSVSGRTLFNILHLNDGELCHYEGGADFSFDIENQSVNKFCVGDMHATIIECDFNRVEKGVEVSAQLIIEGYLVLSSETTVLSDIDGAVVKKESKEYLSFLSACSSLANIDGDKNFNCCASKVICHNDAVRVISALCQVGEVVVEGEIVSEFLFVTSSGEKVCESMVTPFKYEVDCQECAPNKLVVARAQIANRNFKVLANEEAGETLIEGEYAVKIYCSIFDKSGVNCVIDGFSNSNEIDFESQTVDFVTNFSTFNFKHKCFGEGDVKLEKSEKVIATLFPKAQIANQKSENGALKISGAVSYEVVAKNQEEIKCYPCQLPFNATFDFGGDAIYVHPILKGAITRNLDGKCLTECELELVVGSLNSESALVMQNATAGQERNKKQSAISVVFIKKGDSLWDVCKKALASEKSIVQDNPGVTFPAKEDRAVVVYRKL